MLIRETKIYKINTDQGIFEVKGYPAELPGYPEIHVFTREVTQGFLPNQRWCVTELISGLAMSRGHATEQDALEAAEDRVDKSGLDAALNAATKQSMGDADCEIATPKWEGI